MRGGAGSKDWINRKSSKALFRVSLKPEKFESISKQDSSVSQRSSTSTAVSPKLLHSASSDLANRGLEHNAKTPFRDRSVKLQRRLAGAYLTRTNKYTESKRCSAGKSKKSTVSAETINNPRAIFQLAREQSRKSLLSLQSDSDKGPSFISALEPSTSTRTLQSTVEIKESARDIKQPKRINSALNVTRKRRARSRNIASLPVEGSTRESKNSALNNASFRSNVSELTNASSTTNILFDDELEPPVNLTRDLLKSSGIVQKLTTEQRIKMHRERHMLGKEWLRKVKLRKPKKPESEPSIEWKFDSRHKLKPVYHSSGRPKMQTHSNQETLPNDDDRRIKLMNELQQKLIENEAMAEIKDNGIQNEFGIDPFTLVYNEDVELRKVFYSLPDDKWPEWLDLATLIPVTEEVYNLSDAESTAAASEEAEVENGSAHSAENSEPGGASRASQVDIVARDEFRSKPSTSSSVSLIHSQQVHVRVVHRIGGRTSNQHRRVASDWLDLSDAIERPLHQMPRRENHIVWPSNTMSFSQFYRLLHPSYELPNRYSAFPEFSVKSMESPSWATFLKKQSSVCLNLRKQIASNMECMQVFMPLLEEHEFCLQFQQLDLSCNGLGPNALKWMEFLHSFPSPPLLHNIKHLNVANNRLCDRGVKILCQTLPSLCPALTRLNLSCNTIGSKGGSYIGNLLKANVLRIEELVLAWNILGPKGVEAVCAPIASHDRSLLSLDLSNNRMGCYSTCGLKAADVGGALRCVGDMVASNTSLLHLNLAYNYLDAESCAALGDDLQANHTLLGLHLEGNACAMNHSGSILPTTLSATCQGRELRRISNFSAAATQLHDSWLSRCGLTHPSQAEELAAETKCWVCRGYVERSFTYRPRVSGPAPTLSMDVPSADGVSGADTSTPTHEKQDTSTNSLSVSVHIQTFDWMEKCMVRRVDAEGEFWTTCVALPPGEHHYFYSVSCPAEEDDTLYGFSWKQGPRRAVVARDQEKVQVEDPIAFRDPSYLHLPMGQGPGYLNLVAVTRRAGAMEFRYCQPRLPEFESPMPKKAPRVVRLASTRASPGVGDPSTGASEGGGPGLTEARKSLKGFSPLSSHDWALLEDWRQAVALSPGLRAILDTFDVLKFETIFTHFRKAYPLLCNLFRYYSCWRWEEVGIPHPSVFCVVDDPSEFNQSRAKRSKKKKKREDEKKIKKQLDAFSSQNTTDPSNALILRCHQFVQFLNCFFKLSFERLQQSPWGKPNASWFREDERKKLAAKLFWNVLSNNGTSTVPTSQNVRIKCERFEFTILSMIEIARSLFPEGEIALSLPHLLENVVSPTFAVTARIQPESFLKERHYNVLMEDYLKSLSQTLGTLYAFTQEIDGSNDMAQTGVEIRQWVKLFQTAGVLPHNIESEQKGLFTASDCAFAFSLSLKLPVHQDRNCSKLASFADFCEALSRVADMLYIPDTKRIKALGLPNVWAYHCFVLQTGLLEMSGIGDKTTTSVSNDCDFMTNPKSCPKIHLSSSFGALVELLVDGISSFPLQTELEARYWHFGAQWYASMVSLSENEMEELLSKLRPRTRSTLDVLDSKGSHFEAVAQKRADTDVKCNLDGIHGFEQHLAVELKRRLGPQCLNPSFIADSASKVVFEMDREHSSLKSWCTNFYSPIGSEQWFRDLTPFLLVAHLTCECIREAWLQFEVENTRGPTCVDGKNSYDGNNLLNQLCSDFFLERSASKLHLSWVARSMLAFPVDSRLRVPYDELPGRTKQDIQNIVQIGVLVFLEHMLNK